MLKNIREYIDSSEFRLTLLKERVNIVNYKELLQINSKEMILTNSTSTIKIIGDNLVLAKLLEREVLITGLISKIEVIDE